MHRETLSDKEDLNTMATKTVEIEERFSIVWFVVQLVVQFTLLLLGFRFLFPAIWARQLEAGWPSITLVFLGWHLFMCFFEWGFHRYVLHAVTTPALNWFARAHRNHHGLTPIKLRPMSEGSDRYVLNRYPITEEEQHPDSAFPPYALLAFWAFFTPALLLLQWIFPHVPVLLGGYTAITWSMFLYEVLHAIEHLSYDWWKHAIEHPVFGPMWTKLYGFHHMHHANIQCNEAISGFFGIPVADFVFRTYHQPRELLLDGRVASAKDFAVKPAPGWVKAIDQWVAKRESQYRHTGKV